MGTTIDDVLHQHVEEEEYRQEEIDKSIADRKSTLIAEHAIEIHDYLPVDRDPIAHNYILYLWDSFITLDTLGEAGRGFSIMPFHVLFMLALQYKILRITKVFSKECNLVFCTAGARCKDQLVDPKKSVFDLALLNERTLPELFKLINLDDDIIKQIKNLVDYRNDKLAHPKGGIEDDPDGKIELYLDILKNIQSCMLALNDGVAEKWLSEMELEVAGIEYIDLHLAAECLCPADMQQGKLSQLGNSLKGIKEP